ncbi:MAG TPA: ATP-binding protein [Gemmatimonadaceae bacterium]|nr:ATP-binding protein [Gemmatimonadaceae bacterium]
MAPPSPALPDADVPRDAVPEVALRQGTLPTLLDEAPCGFLSFTSKGTTTAVNTTLARMLGYEPRDIVGIQVRAILTAPTQIFMQTHFYPMLQLQRQAEEIYLTLKSRSGEPVHVLANAAMRDRDGATHIDCVFMRIHERQKYEQELLRARKAADEANRSKVEFLSMMSHDLRTPLNAVNGYADLLLMGVRGELTEPQQKDLHRIKAAGKFLLGLINDILSFAKLELGKAELHIKPIPVVSAMMQAESLLGTRFAEAGVAYRREEVSEDLLVNADPDRLQQILLNLLTNAAKFTPSGGRVTLSASRAGERVNIVVADTGRGIPPDQITEIFKPFSQVDPQADRKKGGVGLGLAIGRELARSMEGDLTVVSELGRGSEFTVSLPAV